MRRMRESVYLSIYMHVCTCVYVFLYVYEYEYVYVYVYEPGFAVQGRGLQVAFV